MIWRAIKLAAAISQAFPDVPPARALPAAIAITAVHGGHEPALLAAIAHRESRMRWQVVNARGCAGAMQVCGRGRYRTERASYAAGVRKLDEARAWCRRRRTPTTLCELAVYASGPRGARDRLYRGSRAVLARRDQLRALMGGRPGAAAEGRSSS